MLDFFWTNEAWLAAFILGADARCAGKKIRGFFASL